MPVQSLPFIPADPLSLWGELHPRARHGFFFGSGAGTDNDHILFFSAGEPINISLTLPSPLTGEGNNFPRFVGFLGFEAGRQFDLGLARLPSKANPLKTPVMWFGEFPSVVKVDLKKGVTTVSADNSRELKRIVDLIQRGRHERYSGSTPAFLSRSTGTPPAPARRFHHLSAAQFTKRVNKAKQAIARGDIYQANLSIRFERAFTGNPVDLYRLLCLTNPSPYAGILKMGPRWIVSCSPELLVSVDGKSICTRPIAGTRPRGTTAKKDARLKGQLLLSPKERAEHIMLVDLERNDLGRVSTPGSVHVTERFAIERYSHVMHIVSEVRGKLRKGATAMDAVKGLFPGGTITGCPKISSVETIEKLEGEARGPFYGSAGYFAANGDAKFNILIRTALIQNKKVYVQAGAGIVADSKPAKEYKETLAKAQALLEAIASL